MQHCCMFVSFRFFRIYSFLIISASFDPRTIHTHARTRFHSLLHCFSFLFFSTVACVCVAWYIYFLSLFRNWPSDLLLALFLPTLVYNAVLFSSSSSVCHCDLFLLYSFSLTLMFLFWRSFALSRFHALSITQSKLVFTLPLLQHISRVASNKKASNLWTHAILILI